MIKDDTINILAEPVRELVCPECEHAIDVSEMEMLAPVKCPDCGADLTVPARLGDFVLVEVLGSGGMATVYKAYDESLGRYVAVKIMRRKFGQDQKFVESFLKEARAAARINHPNVVQIYSCGAKNGQPYIIMELVNGEKFDDLIANDAPMDERRVIGIGIDVANGLRAASDIGIVHGDIKPANIIFDPNGMAKVADFGLAHFAQEQEERSEIWGTPYYIAPERARKKGQDSQADIYCLGATLFHALTGQPPFDGETAVDVVMARLKQPAPGLRDIVPAIGAHAAKVVGRMLEKEKIRRYPNYNSLLSDLEKAEDDPGSSEPAVKKPRRAEKKRAKKSEKPGKKKKSGPKPAIFLLLLLLLAAAGLGAWFLIGRDKPAEEEAPPPEKSGETTAEDSALQPFDEERDERLTEILGDMLPSTSIASERDLFHFSQGLAPNDARRMWARLFAGIAAMLQSKSEKAGEYYKQVAVAEGGSEAAELPRHLAQYMSGQGDGAAAPEGSEWPQWYSDLSLIFAGVHALADQDPAAAISKLEQYSESEGAEEPSWPYAMNGFARDLGRRIKAWQSISATVDDMLAEDNYDQALKMLEDRVKSGVFIPLRDSRIAEIEAARKEYRNEQRHKEDAARAKEKVEAERKARAKEERMAREEAERAEKIAADQKLLDSWEQRSALLLKANRFDQAEELLESVEDKIGSPSVAEELAKHARAVERLSELKSFLVSAINSMPYSGGRNILKGRAMSATSDVIIVELAGGAGQTSYDWTRVGPRLLIPMAKFYMSRANLNSGRQAELLMALAGYSKIHDLGMEDRFKAMAEKSKPGISGE